MSYLRLEALEALIGCPLEDSGPRERSVLWPQDLVNLVSLKRLYEQDGLQQMEYPSLGSMSLREEENPEARPKVPINLQTFFHNKYDYDFTNIQDGDRQFHRGGERYGRPCGWRRFALSVSQKYDNGNDAWLGTNVSSWPVSYHVLRSNTDAGSPQEDAVSIVFFSGGQEEVPRGVCCTPDVHLAEQYCKIFKSKSDGRKYKVLLQNRIHPTHKGRPSDPFWVVQIPKTHNEFQTKTLVQESVRPYGLLVKLV